MSSEKPGKIILDDHWIEVTSDEMKAKAKILESTISAEILGHDQELYGYLIYRSGDIVSVRIGKQRPGGDPGAKPVN